MDLPQPLSPQISMSIIALADAISRAAPIIYELNFADLRLNWGTSSLLTQRLLAKGWCPKDVAMLTLGKDRTVDVQYYASSMSYSRGALDHKGCTDRFCCLDKVDETTYATSHVNTNCTCMHVEASRDINNIISRGRIPLVSFRKNRDEDEYQLRVSKFLPESSISRYVAISHV